MSAQVVADGVTAMELVGEAPITYRQLDYWTRSGYLRLNDRRPGSGHPRTYSWTERSVAITMGRLVNAGLLPPVAAEVARDMVEQTAETVSIAPGVSVTVGEPT